MGGKLRDRVAIVVGAGSVGPGWGNGKAAAVLFAREGARVLAVDIDADAAGETAAIVAREGGTAETFTADVSRADEVRAMVDACLDRFGRIDVLHNNVGIVQPRPTAEVDEAEWDRVCAVNLKGMFLACRAVLPAMERNAFRVDEDGRRIGRGAIVNISSVSGIRWTGVPYVTYSVTKGAVLPLTRSIALEYAARGIRANAILPGLMNTPMIVEPLKDAYGGGDVGRMIEARDAQCPTGYMGDGWDVARAALFLASDDARYVTGAELVVDGGISAKLV
ncbi:MAG: SDR family NAD(P)-dependent oxidoreductase [Defluviicoccus sp.]|nr:SDR family NAD(P)-dependent oxidoreductase [Defluviicoccus sp.]MDE0382598.1 SDR family NAD(P)-dependent oxidoreductase [Defluviicoccus sp.]